MTDVLSIALSGLNSASTRANTAAAKIAGAATADSGEGAASSENYITDIVDLKQAATAYKANAVVARVASEMDRELLNRFDETV